MPAQPGEAPQQPRGLQAALGQHDHRPAAGAGRPPQAPPGVLGARGQEHPRHGDGTAPRDHADRQHHKASPQGGGIHGPRQLRALPPAPHPAHQGRTAGLDAQRLAPRVRLASSHPARRCWRPVCSWRSVASRLLTAGRAHERASTMPKLHRANTVAWGLLQCDRCCMIVVSHWLQPAWKNMASLLRVVGPCIPHTMPSGGKSITYFT